MIHSRQAVGWMWVLWYFYWMAAAAGPGKTTVKRESLSSVIRQRLLLLAGYVLLVAPVRVFGLAEPWVRPSVGTGRAGIWVCLLGLGFSVWARRALGDNWSSTAAVKENHQLVQTGPYAFVRHPIYTGLLTAALGTALAEDRVGSLLGSALMAFGLHFKMGVEERFMREEFGGGYSAYARKVKKLLPWIY
jgi:protein-S-isoprenylcysteine O-methyltransferase Ste14